MFAFIKLLLLFAFIDQLWLSLYYLWVIEKWGAKGWTILSETYYNFPQNRQNAALVALLAKIEKIAVNFFSRSLLKNRNCSHVRNVFFDIFSDWKRQQKEEQKAAEESEKML